MQLTAAVGRGSCRVALASTSAMVAQRRALGAALTLSAAKSLVSAVVTPQASPMLGCVHRTATSGAPSSSATPVAAEGGTGSGAGPNTKRDEKDPPLGWGRFTLYGVSGISSLLFLYYFYKAKYSLHTMELLLLERWRMLPLYPAPGPSAAEENTRIDPQGLPFDLVDAFAEWFVALDLREPSGVTRDDVLELLREMGFGEEEQPCKDFLMRGDGQLEERRRLSGAGLQESIGLLAKLAASPGKDSAEQQQARVGSDSVELLRRKNAGVGSVLNAASALQQAMQMPGASGPLAVGGPTMPPEVPVPTRSPAQDSAEATDESGVDDAAQRRMEATRLARLEEGLLAKLERLGSLSPAEEARLRDVRERKAKL
mmetsp:Transcript_31712/g.73571  ORF Transcript_31712/g.73571 Transcript_31712/m.73571 type:complete len:371 (+) Transcript_31712:50-1162(+)